MRRLLLTLTAVLFSAPALAAGAAPICNMLTGALTARLGHLTKALCNVASRFTQKSVQAVIHWNISHSVTWLI